MRSWPSTGVATVALALVSCAEDQAPAVPEDRLCPSESFLTYENFGAPFLSEHCTGCHSALVPDDMRQQAPRGIDFETLAKVRERDGLIFRRAADDNATMPPIGGPGAEERRLLGDWLACGAPD